MEFGRCERFCGRFGSWFALCLAAVLFVFLFLSLVKKDQGRGDDMTLHDRFDVGWSGIDI